MTVEQNVLQPGPAAKHQQTFLNQLREITGINDIQVLQQALKDSNGNLELAVAFLTAKNAKVPQQEEATYYQTALPGNDRYISVGSQADTNVIDLTGDDKDDLQRAIALSLEESNRAFRETGITDEEQAISRVLEASIAENKASLKRTHPEVWSDSPNPYDRKRQDNCPVGLKNVGNTCWFSAVIQSLFNLLEFRRLVLNFNPPANAQDLPRNQKEHRNLPFMRELRYLFALLVGSKRKYVDPSRAVEILKDAFKSNDSQQQDVSEFTHKLLDWLEDAFQIKAEEERDGEKPKNPMVELFYGRFLAVGVLEGKKFENTEMFGQYPLQVNGFKDLHECLEAAMIEGEIESLHSENSAKSGQEHWFTELPPVLTFELSRFEFNQALGRPEKIHNKLEFPPILYLDRYMHKNREITRIKRDEIKRLKEYLTVLQQRLERYLSYGSGPKRFPLVDVLQYALEFASSKPVCTSPVDDLGASAPSSGTLPAQTSPSTIDQQGPSSSDVPSTSPVQRSVIHKPFTQSRIPPDLPMHPAPRHITEEELSVLEGCLHRWRTEVENDTRDLQESISRIHRTIELMYSDKTMVQVPYRLHAVLVHEGQANAGHYWAYIYDHHQNRWMKYNDISVTKSTWEELERDSFGGYRNASAYCLMYINDKEQYLIQEEFNKETGQILLGMDTLPSDLRDYVKEDNKRFEKELEEWDAELAQKAQQEKLLSQIPRAPAPSPAPVQAGEPEYLEQPSRTDLSKHLKEDSVQAINKALAEQEDRGPEAIMDTSSDNAPAPPAPNQRVVEVAIPDVGTFVIESEEGGYDDEVMLTPNMQGIIMAIGKARNVYDRCGPEAGFFKAIKLEYARLLKLAQEDPPPECDYRLRHAIVYFIQNQAPKKIIERTLLEQFGDHNLSFDERCRNIMKVAQAKLEMIKPDEVNMEEYERWHQDYRNFRETTMFLMVGLEFFQKKSYMEALLYLIYAYQNNKELLSKGPYRGHDEELISHYRRECLLKLNEHAAALFESGDDQEVNNGLIIMNELIVPCLPLLLVDEMEEKDIVAVEDMRNRWCSYLGQEMEPNLQEKLTDFLPKLLDCSTEIKGFNDPPKLPSYSTHELCERYARIMMSLSRTPADGR
ncbi:ubiquitin carboxyl-terminal hydrolase 25 isoform X1 [Anas acuta]|uniref:Ubiquitin carboxyl-terminal hydrolase 25 n=2 Tax=Anas TaxID=8835 RepID=A0A8B9QT04_ANAPL|nr:ubiquitin carboxyl-terminal hydrolase 25 isoform X1 [Anas platyrhynchos]|eukprot:XP_027305079.1 ubiquitin carboxyl-terminal hydrolase 25 isoform X1 [Anas platyrhynchos]